MEMEKFFFAVLRKRREKTLKISMMLVYLSAPNSRMLQDQKR
jgi:hypothetical protein